MRNAFAYELSALTGQLGELCGMAGQAMNDATYALLHADSGVADDVIASQEVTAAMSSSVEETTLLLFALQTPVAADLRTVLGAIKIAGHAECMSELALQIAKIARRRHPYSAVPEEVSGHVTDMSALAVALARSAQEMLLSHDPAAGAHIRHDAEAVDDLNRSLMDTLTDDGWAHGVAAAVDVARLVRCYQRFTDHADQIARRAIFRTNGHDARLAVTH
jgi:phosphate transport system protein